MHVRQAEEHEEVWLLNRIDEENLIELSFEPENYIVAIDEETGDPLVGIQFILLNAMKSLRFETLEVLRRLGTKLNWQ